MANEYRLNYTAEEIDAKLATVDETKNTLENNYYNSLEIEGMFEQANSEVEANLATKADLVDGKIPTSQLPDDMVDLSNYYTKSETDNLIGDCDAVINSINTLIGGESV